jgi:ammonia channel protein AmtB
MGVLGTIILFFGWFGFNPGSSIGLLIPAITDASGAVVTPASLIPLNLAALRLSTPCWLGLRVGLVPWSIAGSLWTLKNRHRRYR